MFQRRKALMLPALVLLLLSRLVGADEDESVKIILCFGVRKITFEG